MSLDLAAEVIAALRSQEGRAAVAAAVAPVIADEVRRAFEERGEQLEPVSRILGCGPKAASARIARSAELRALCLKVGQRWVAKRSTIEAHYALRGRELDA